MFLALILIAFASSGASSSQPGPCEPDPALQLEIQQAAARQPTNPTAFDENVGPFLALRQHHPDDLFVHERYQDAVQQFGIEGHLRMLTQEYQALAIAHPGDVRYRYLNARALIGRSTPSAIQELNQLIGENPDFAPAHQSLAEIYASEIFRDEAKAKTEKQNFLTLCPGSELASRPGPLPEPSPLLDQAERLLGQRGDPNHVLDVVLEALRSDEWRLQRIRPFDWYSSGHKREAQQALHSRYWQAWSIQVRCYRRANQPEKAVGLLRSMEQRAVVLKSSDPMYWDASAALARLYAEANQQELAAQKLDFMRQFLSSHPDDRRARQLEELQKVIANPVGPGMP